MPEKKTKYAIVQHSGWGYKKDPQFIRGLEVRAVSGKEIHAVEKAGGLLFDSYMAAQDFEDTAPYPPGYTKLIPNAQGTFSNLTIDGLAVYIPVRKVVG